MAPNKSHPKERLEDVVKVKGKKRGDEVKVTGVDRTVPRIVRSRL